MEKQITKKTKLKHILKFGIKVLLITFTAVIINSIFAFIFEQEWLFILGLIILPTFGIIITLLVDNHIYWGDIDEQIRNEQERKGFREIIRRIKKRKEREKQEVNKDNRKDNGGSNSSDNKSVLGNRKTNMGNGNGVYREHRQGQTTKNIFKNEKKTKKSNNKK